MSSYDLEELAATLSIGWPHVLDLQRFRNTQHLWSIAARVFARSMEAPESVASCRHELKRGLAPAISKAGGVSSMSGIAMLPLILSVRRWRRFPDVPVRPCHFACDNGDVERC